jgi:hypothetical protein
MRQTQLTATDSKRQRLTRRAFSSYRRELNDKEPASRAIIKILLDDIDRLEDETERLSEYRDRFYKADKEAAILRQRLCASVAQEVISMTCMTLSGIIIGAAFSISPDTWVRVGVIVIGSVLLLAGIIAKVIRT